MMTKQILVSNRKMKIIILCLLGLLTFSQARILKFNPRIINGEDVELDEIPYQVSLQYNSSNFHFCGGSILNENYVITAAHCVKGERKENINVFAGIIDLKKSESPHKVADIIIHENYNESNSWINDIALLKVTPAFEISDPSKHIKSVTLPESDKLKTGQNVVISGWGYIYSGGPGTNKLKRAYNRISDQNYCFSKYDSIGYKIYETQVCANEPLHKQGVCNGDSGGPLTTANGELVGLASWSNDCADTKFPTVYTRVVKYLDWIKLKVN